MRDKRTPKDVCGKASSIGAIKFFGFYKKNVEFYGIRYFSFYKAWWCCSELLNSPKRLVHWVVIWNNAISLNVRWRLPSPCTAFSQSPSVNSFRWRIRGEWAGNALTFSHGPRDPKRFGREENWGLGTRQRWRNFRMLGLRYCTLGTRRNVLACGGNFRCWPKADTPETAREKSLGTQGIVTLTSVHTFHQHVV